MPVNDRHSFRSDSVRLFTDARAGQCLVITDNGGKVVTSGYVDCVALRSGRKGDLIPVAQKYGQTYDIPGYILPRGGLLYLGTDGYMKGAVDSPHQTVVGRYVDTHRFVFSPGKAARPASLISKSHVLLSLDVWDNTIIFNPGDIVNYQGVLYRNLTGSSLEPPKQDDWEVFTSGDGSGGSAVARYIHTQTVAADAWHIQHNLGVWPVCVFTENQSGEQIIGQIDTAISTHNLLVIRFSEPLSGAAYISG